MKESIFASMGSIQLKVILYLLFYYTYMYSKFGDNRMELMILRGDIQFIGKFIPNLWGSYSSNFDRIYTFTAPIFIPSLVTIEQKLRFLLCL